MKSEKTNEFWKWFREVAGSLSTNIENPALLKELDARIRELDPRLSWEIGPGFSKPWQLAISPNLNRNLRDLARQIVSGAPNLASWEFYPTRQPKREWSYKLEFETTDGQTLRVDASTWCFIMLRYPTGTHEVLLKGDELSHLNKDERWQAAAITLESILGEDAILDRIDDFELVDDFGDRFEGKQKPIQNLRQVILGF